MSFEPAQPISVITCDQCQGKGCPACDYRGVYALQDDQPITFNLPDFIDLKTRKILKNIFIIKRAALLTVALVIIFVVWKIL
ncbi:MAG: hypothetical protein NTZ93_04235 [Candidatus Beckwithbacteria bacterium]|nr:hypothetical protein [Candidatus Beckwithbacteria bacterium]